MIMRRQTPGTPGVPRRHISLRFESESRINNPTGLNTCESTRKILLPCDLLKEFSLQIFISSMHHVKGRLIILTMSLENIEEKVITSY